MRVCDSLHEFVRVCVLVAANNKSCSPEMAIFGDASLIISIAASEVNLEAGD